MKNIIALLLLATAITVSAAETPKAKPATNDTVTWFSTWSVSTVGAIKTEHLDGPSQWGAGLDIGASVNPFVSLHVVNLSFEGPVQTTTQQKTKGGFKTVTTGEDPWRGLLVDETDVQIDAKLSRFSNESFSLHLVSGGQYDWNDKDYGINAGLRLVFDFNKHVGISAGYSIRTWFKGDTHVDSLATAQLGLSF